MFLVAYTAARTNSFSADWKLTVYFKSTSPTKFGVCRWTIRLWCMKFGIAHHTTGQFRKGSNRNTAAIADEMPFGIGVLFSDDFVADCRISVSSIQLVLHLQTEALG